MNTIWKFPVPVEDRFALTLPRGAQFLSVQTQHDEPQSWWLLDPSEPDRERHLRVYGTGHPVPDADALRFLGTFQMHGGSLVFHLFEEMR